MSDVGDLLADRYVLRQLLGRGGMGEVWHAWDTDLERDVALKSLLPHLAKEPELIGRFRREARALARLRHPGIVGVFDMLRLPDGRVFLVLEYVPGEPLDRPISRGALPWSRCVEIGAGVCDALAVAHAEGIVHRDIKPSNILIEPRGQVRVADFGLARLAGVGPDSGSDIVTRTGIVMGTPGYWAPEQAMGKRITPQTDLYALGAVLYEAATGRLPFVAEEPGPAAAFMHITAPLPDPRTFRGDLSGEAAAVLMRSLAKDPEERFASASDMADALRATLRATPTVVAPPAHAPTPPVAPTVTPGAAAPVASTMLPPAATAGATAAATAAATAGATEVATGGTQVTSPDSERTELGGTPAAVGGPWSPPPGTIAAPPPSPPAGGYPPPSPPGGGYPPPAPDRRPPTPPHGDDAATRSLGRPSRSALPAVVGIVVLAAVAGAGGLFLGRDRGASTTPPPDAVALAGDGMSIDIPQDWNRTAPLPPRGITFSQGGLGASYPGGGGVVAGYVDTNRPDYLPAEIGDRAPEPTPVKLADSTGYRYENVPVDGGGTTTLYVVPTARGVATVACVPGDNPDAVNPVCADAAASLAVTGPAVFSATPSADYATRLTTTFGELADTVGTQRQSLDDARRPAGQQAAARRLSAAYSSAAGKLPARGLSPATQVANAEIVSALRGTAAAYRDLQRASAADSPARWAAARRAVTRAEARVARAREGLARLGYTV